MKIRVHLILTTYAENGEILVPVASPVPLSEILKDIGIPEDEVGIAVRNGRWVKRDVLVTDGDEVDLFPLLSGG